MTANDAVASRATLKLALRTWRWQVMRADDDASTSWSLFGLWDLLAMIEEIATRALSGGPVDRDSLALRLQVFGREELPEARRTAQVAILTSAEIRDLIEGAPGYEVGRVIPWPSDSARLDEEVNRLVVTAGTVSFLSSEVMREREQLSDSQRSRFIRQALGFVAGSMSLSDAQMELNVRWLLKGISGLDSGDRRWLCAAADLVFWGAAFLTAAIDDTLGSDFAG